MQGNETAVPQTKKTTGKSPCPTEQMQIITPEELHEISRTQFTADEPVSEEQLELLNKKVTKVLKNTAMGGINGCEVRFPYEDYDFSCEVLESAATILATRYKEAGFQVTRVWRNAAPALCFAWR